MAEEKHKCKQFYTLRDEDGEVYSAECVVCGREVI